MPYRVENNGLISMYTDSFGFSFVTLEISVLLNSKIHILTLTNVLSVSFGNKINKEKYVSFYIALQYYYIYKTLKQYCSIILCIY
jgi:hypothetical protein